MAADKSAPGNTLPNDDVITVSDEALLKAESFVEAEEGAAYGAAILAGVGARVWNSVDAACSAVVRVAERVAPQPAVVERMNASYAAYRRMYPAIASVLGASVLG